MAVILFIFIIFPCHCAVYMYKIMILQKPLSQFPPRFRIDPIVVMIGLEKYCITSAYLQWLLYVSQVSEPWLLGLLFNISVLLHQGFIQVFWEKAPGQKWKKSSTKHQNWEHDFTREMPG